MRWTVDVVCGCVDRPCDRRVPRVPMCVIQPWWLMRLRFLCRPSRVWVHKLYKIRSADAGCGTLSHSASTQIASDGGSKRSHAARAPLRFSVLSSHWLVRQIALLGRQCACACGGAGEVQRGAGAHDEPVECRETRRKRARIYPGRKRIAVCAFTITSNSVITADPQGPGGGGRQGYIIFAYDEQEHPRTSRDS